MLEKILKAVEGSIAIEKRTLPSEKIECANLQILLPEKKVYRNGKEILLNRHEFDTLVYLARHTFYFFFRIPTIFRFYLPKGKCGSI